MRKYYHLLASFAVTLLLASTVQAASDRLPVLSGPLSLKDAVQTALKCSPMVQEAGYQALAAQSRVGMAKAMTKPLASVTAIGGTANMPGIFPSTPNVAPGNIIAFPSSTAGTAQLMGMIPVYTGGRLAAMVRGAESLSSAASSDRAATERNVALETTMNYHRAIFAGATVDVYRGLVREEEERVRIAEAAFKEGKIAKYDLLRNQSELADAKQQLADAERDAAISLINLKTVLGASQDSAITLSDSLGYTPVEGSLDVLEQAAEKSRPELAAVRSRVSSAKANLDVAKSAFKPQVYANGMLGATGMSGGSESGYTIGIAAALPVLDGGQRRAGVKEAEAMAEAMKREETQALLVVHRDVRNAWTEAAASDKKVPLSEAAVAQADEDYRVIKLRYESGKAINVEVLDALQALTKARNNRLMALYEHNIARDMLAKAVGEM